MKKAPISSLLDQISNLSYGFVASTDSKGEGKAHLDAIAPEISTVKQVHGKDLVWCTQKEKQVRQADAIATEIPGLPVGVYSADCTPVLLAGVKNGKALAVAAIHAGWRGTALKICEIGLQEFSKKCRTLGAEYIIASIGPCISKSKFEVGEELLEQFPEAKEAGFFSFLREEEGKRKYLFDLVSENRRQLIQAAASNQIKLTVDDVALCTFSDLAWPSFRRDREKAGRILSHIRFQ